MKRPEKIVMWAHVDKEKSDFVNHLGKPLFNYTIRLPSWVGLAYNPRDIKIEIRAKNPPFNERHEDGNHEEIQAYVKTNWINKLTKMRKLNYGYMQVFTIARADVRQVLSIEEYNRYHQELRELNVKYGIVKSVDSDNSRSKMKCGYGVEESEKGSEKCTGCHWSLKGGSCDWTPEKGVNDLDGPTTIIGPYPVFSSAQSKGGQIS